MESARAFRLNRYFSWASLAGTVVVLAILVFAYREFAFTKLIANETRSNVALARALSNSIWPEYASFFAEAVDLSTEELRRRPELDALGTELRRQLRGLTVAKVKIYGLDGRTVFSTEAGQIGEETDNNPGLIAARLGRPTSSLTYRGEFYGFEQVIVDRNLLTTYIPIQRDAGAPIEGVFELYSDVTVLVEELERSQWQIAGIVLGSLGILYLFMALVVRRADRIIRANEARVLHQAHHDALTGLPNRHSFTRYLADSVTNSERTGQRFAVLFLDLDRFKLVNDSLGHDPGDELLRTVAVRIGACLPDGDRLFRMGGDEFTVLVQNVACQDDAAAVAQRVLQCLSEPVRLAEREVIISGSVGITLFPQDDVVPDKLVQNADTAMYLAKALGGNQYAFYARDMSLQMAERLALETELQQALAREEFVLHYQPRVAAATGRIVGMEALLRWCHPRRGIVLPDQFIPILEETGRIVPVGQWVLQAACAQAKGWQDSWLPELRMSVNISPREFRSEGFVDTVRQTLGRTGLMPGSLEIEVTESLLIEDAEGTAAVMARLKALGVRIALDDFGSGYSSLNYLKRFPIDLLKIDRAFVRDLETNPKDAAIVRAIAVLAQSLGIGLVAEGVEDRWQAEFLRTQRCDELQGYLFARPMAPEQIPRLVHARA